MMHGSRAAVSSPLVPGSKRASAAHVAACFCAATLRYHAAALGYAAVLRIERRWKQWQLPTQGANRQTLLPPTALRGSSPLGGACGRAIARKPQRLGAFKSLPSALQLMLAFDAATSHCPLVWRPVVAGIPTTTPFYHDLFSMYAAQCLYFTCGGCQPRRALRVGSARAVATTGCLCCRIPYAL